MARYAIFTAVNPEAHRPVDRHCGYAGRNPGKQGTHTRHIAIILTGLVGTAQIDFFDLLRVEVISVYKRFQDSRTQSSGRTRPAFPPVRRSVVRMASTITASVIISSRVWILKKFYH